MWGNLGCPAHAGIDLRATSITTTSLWRDIYWWSAGGAAFFMRASRPFVAQLDILQPAQQLMRSEPVPGQHFTHHPVHLRAGDQGHLFPPSLAAKSSGKPRPTGIGRYGDASQSRNGSRIHPAPRRSFRSRIPFRYASGILPRKPTSPGECPRGRWTGSAKFAAVQVLAVYRPGLFTRLPVPRYPHPLGIEPVGSWPLCSLRHRHLPPLFLR